MDNYLPLVQREDWKKSSGMDLLDLTDKVKKKKYFQDISKDIQFSRFDKVTVYIVLSVIESVMCDRRWWSTPDWFKKAAASS